MSLKVDALDHLVINVSDVARTAQWYRDILGMQIKIFDPGHGKTRRMRRPAATICAFSPRTRRKRWSRI
jgi:catechol 2,3-dioxygenase-like lactoylglutathione lyase family enzyme